MLTEKDVLKVVSLSIDHISVEDDEFLDEIDSSVLEAINYGDAVHVSIPAGIDLSELRPAGFSEEFCQILRKARELGAEAVIFEVCGKVHDDMRLFRPR